MTILIVSGIWGGVKSAIKQATTWVSSAVKSSLGAEETYQDISDFLDPDLTEGEFIGQYELYEDSLGVWSKITDLPDFYRIPENFATPTSLDYRQKHIMKMKVQAFDLNTDEVIERWITVESDTPMQKSSWISAGQSAASDTLAGTDLIIEEVLEFEYYIKEDSF